MTATAKAQEPSMEEILASIRRIIADDDAPAKDAPKEAAKPAAKAPEPAAPQGQDDIDALMASFEAEAEEDMPVEDEDVLELDQQVEASAAVPSGFKPIDGKHDLEFQEFEEPAPEPEPEPEPAPMPQMMAPPPRIVETPAFTAADPMEALVSNATSSAVSNAFGSLAHTVLMQNARTLDDLVKEMLRPMLKQWLDDNLPTMVERLVRSEIERVSRGRPS